MLLKHFLTGFFPSVTGNFAVDFQANRSPEHGCMFLESNRKSKNTFKNYDDGFWVSGDDLLLVIMHLF